MAAPRCCIHFETVSDEETVLCFTQRTFEQAKFCIEKWAKFVSQQGDVARHFERSVICQNADEATNQGHGMMDITRNATAAFQTVQGKMAISYSVLV